MRLRLHWLLIAAAPALPGCDEGAPPAGGAATEIVASSSAPPPRPPAPSARPAAAAAPALEPIAATELARLFRELSEPDEYFFSDNFVSNETSLLQVAPLLERHVRKGGAYIGVGPEQNFSYIALVEPKLAFVVDIRRQNAMQHLLFKALFHEADDRAEFLALLLGRALTAPAEKNASIEALLAHVEKAPAEREQFERVHRRARDRITSDFGIALSKKDLETVERTHRAFFEDQLDLKFELHEQNGRKYPALRQLLSATDPNGEARGFLASDQAFALVKRLHEQNRIIPVVGDFAGTHALAAIARELRRRDLPVSAFYVSNVEQYVLEPDKWRRWVDNVAALPSDDKSVFIRCYLDQGRRHPRQLAGHRTATVLQRFDHFKWRQKKQSYTAFWTLANDGNL